VGSPAAGQAAIRHSSPAAPAPTAAAGEHWVSPSLPQRAPSRSAPRVTPGNSSAAATRAAALSGTPVGQVMLVTLRENGLLLRRTCLTVAAPPRKGATASGEVRLGSIR
jgi:hypothetical protein